MLTNTETSFTCRLYKINMLPLYWQTLPLYIRSQAHNPLVHVPWPEQVLPLHESSESTKDCT